MSDKRKFFSQKHKLVLLLIFSFAAGVLLYFLLSHIFANLLENKWNDQEWRQKRNSEFASSLQSYVDENNVSLEDHEKIMEWREGHSNVVLSVQKDGKTVFGTDPAISGISDFFNGMVESFPVRFSDAEAEVFILDQSDVLWRRSLNVLSLLAGFLLFFVLFWMQIRRNVQKLVRLSEEVKSIKTEGLEAKITLTGNDEIAEIAYNIEDMRNSLIQRFADEKRELEANNELIAAVSHDIRTPLTALIGYLDLLKEGKDLSEDQRGRYLENSYSKAMQLKDLTDKLFQYFLVVSGRIQNDRKEYNAPMLLEQIIGEHIAYLESFGFQFEVQPFDQEGFISVDMTYLMRLFDNIFSNIEKYADREKPVAVSNEISESMIEIRFQNSICRTKPGSESTKIGLRTCETIMSLLGGQFEYQSDEERFTVSVRLPFSTEGET